MSTPGFYQRDWRASLGLCDLLGRGGCRRRQKEPARQIFAYGRNIELWRLLRGRSARLIGDKQIVVVLADKPGDADCGVTVEEWIEFEISAQQFGIGEITLQKISYVALSARRSAQDVNTYFVIDHAQQGLQ